MTYVLGTIREFETANFKVIVDAIEENNPDISFDDTSETADNLDSGKWVIFCARARVIHKPTGLELGSDYLGNCIYASIEAFEDHRECAKQNAEYERKGIAGRCGSYFADMVHQSISEARETLATMKETRVRS